MCVIAGYTGKRRAAPVLIEMLKRIEYYDGGYATGIATVHEGKIYYAKAIGDVEMLLRTSDALDLPGTTGIIHTRPNGEFFSNCHPYFDADGKLAMVENGGTGATACPELHAEFCAVMNDFLDRGIVSPASRDLDPEAHRNFFTKDGKPFYYIEAYSHLLGDMVKDTPRECLKTELALAVRRIHERLPADNVTVSIYDELPDTVTVGTVTRPMSVLEADGETMIASCATAFPEELQHYPVTHLPQCSVSQITPAGLEIISVGMEGVSSEPVTERVVAYYKAFLEEKLTKKKDAPLSLYDITFPMDIWSEPAVDCKYVGTVRPLKPLMCAVYQALWKLHREGRLHSRLGVVYSRDVAWPNVDCYFTKFWLDEKGT
ncbi:MAG: hypothetical protein E7643_06920 [Ruminococcaceae bacterium]|nr:hypothetical protein [Oscillospiraceae bacterium]